MAPSNYHIFDKRVGAEKNESVFKGETDQRVFTWAPSYIYSAFTYPPPPPLF